VFARGRTAADYNTRTLTVRLHRMANGYSNEAIRKLCDELNATETLFPRTDLRLVPKLGAHNRTREIRISDLAVGHGLTSNRMVTVRKRYGSTPA